MATSKEDVLNFEVAVDIKNSLKAMEKFQRQMAKAMRAVAKGGKKAGDEAAKGSKKAKTETDEWTESVKGLGDAYDKGSESADNLSQTIAELAERLKTLNGEEKKSAQAQLTSLKKINSERKKLGGGGGAAPKGGLFFGRFSPEKVRKELKEAGEDLLEPLQAFLERDLKGIVAGSMKGAGSVLSRSVRFSRAMTEMSGAAFNKRGEQLSAKGKAKGGAQGAALALAGGGMKQMGAMMGKLSGLMSGLAAIGPLLGTVANAAVGLLKMFIDADAMVKEFNRGIMDSASNLEFLENSGWNANAAFQSMTDSLDGMRDAAMDGAFNNALGITKDTHTAILNTLTQEGVALGTLNKQAGNSREGMKALTQSIVEMGVGYSRSLGVPLQEIVTLQAEMAVEMGSSIESTKDAFAGMARAAAASGIAGNKFFGIIRAASADLSLWNFRLEGAVDLLGKLGKIMSPRAAQTFFQTIAAGFKNMGRQDLLRQTLMAGPEKVRKILEQDVSKNQEELADQIAKAGGGKLEDVLTKIRAGGYGAADELIRGVTDKTKVGTLRNKAAEIERKKQGAAGGTYELSQASGEIRSIGGQLEILVSSLESMGGSLLKPNEMALAQVAESQGKSIEEVNQLHSLALAVDAQRKLMLKSGKYTPEQLAKMSADEIIASDESLQSDAEKLQGDQTKREESVQDAIKSLSADQGKKTQSLIDRLDNLVTWFMNTFYNVMIDIWDAIMSIPGVGGKSRNEKRAVYRSGNTDLIRALDGATDSEGALDFFKLKGKALGGSLGENIGKLSGSEEGRRKLTSSVQANFSGAEVLDMAKSSNLSAGKQAALQKMLERQRTTSKVNFGSPTGGIDHSVTTGLANKGELGDLETIFRELNLTVQEQTDLLAKAGWAASSVGSLAGLASGVGSGGAGASPAATTTEAVQASNEQLATIATDGQKLQTTVEQQGIKIAPATIRDQSEGMEQSMLSALRTALFEYYMYSGTDRGTLLTTMQRGGVSDPRAMAQYFGGKSAASGSVAPALEGIGSGLLKANAAGGTVTGISNGMAVVAAQGEGLASVGRGERIVPAGGASGSGVSVVVNGVGGQDLARLIEGKVVDGIREYKRREKFY